MANQLYQLESRRHHYEQALRTIIEQYWDETALLKETERVEALIKPYMVQQSAYRFVRSLEEGGLTQWSRLSLVPDTVLDLALDLDGSSRRLD